MKHDIFPRAFFAPNVCFHLWSFEKYWRYFPSGVRC